jgi:ABC-type glycerol-3-phosphate transport system substrate-binding protein
MMSKITKILILSLTALLTLTLLAGCHNSGQTATDEVNLEAIYDLDVDKITVWRMVDNTQYL